MELIEQKIDESIRKVEVIDRTAFKVERMALKVERKSSKTKWAHAKAIMEARHLQSALKEAKRGIAWEKAWATDAQVDAWTKAAGAIKETKMIIDKMRYNANEEIAWLQSELYVTKKRISFLEHSISQEKSVVTELTRELDAGKEALQIPKRKSSK